MQGSSRTYTLNYRVIHHRICRLLLIPPLITFTWLPGIFSTDTDSGPYLHVSARVTCCTTVCHFQRQTSLWGRQKTYSPHPLVPCHHWWQCVAVQSYFCTDQCFPSLIRVFVVTSLGFYFSMRISTHFYSVQLHSVFGSSTLFLILDILECSFNLVL